MLPRGKRCGSRSRVSRTVAMLPEKGWEVRVSWLELLMEPENCTVEDSGPQWFGKLRNPRRKMPVTFDPSLLRAPSRTTPVVSAAAGTGGGPVWICQLPVSFGASMVPGGFGSVPLGEDPQPMRIAERVSSGMRTRARIRAFCLNERSIGWEAEAVQGYLV